MRCLWNIVLAAILPIVSGCVAPAYRFDAIAIHGTPQFQEQVINALQLLQSNAPTAYVTVTNEIGIIRNAKRSGMRAWTQPPTFDLTDSTAFYSLTWCAGVIAHDSFHSKLYHDYLEQNSTTRRVPDAIWKGEKAESLCLTHQIEVLKDIGAPAHEIDWCKNTNKFWEVEYRNRFW